MTNKNIKNVLLVLSGKGGVGKSTVSVQLALAYQKMGYKVGLLDVDLCGPSIPHMLGLSSKEIYQCDEGWIPVYMDSSKTLAVMSIGFLLSREDESVVWRGPKKTSMIKSFLNDVRWENLDILIVDTPPGTSDEHITIVETLTSGKIPPSSILVTTPQTLAINDVIREYTFCKKTGVKVKGIVENMSGYSCPNCDECSYIFSKDGGKLLAEKTGVPFLGAIPIEPKLAAAIDSGLDFRDNYENSNASDVIDSIVKSIDIFA